MHLVHKHLASAKGLDRPVVHGVRQTLFELVHLGRIDLGGRDHHEPLHALRARRHRERAAVAPVVPLKLRLEHIQVDRIAQQVCGAEGHRLEVHVFEEVNLPVLRFRQGLPLLWHLDQNRDDQHALPT
jgi:hypothetical protein